jgi:C4-dicarboxylate-specific signal transduction histidine kinase
MIAVAQRASEVMDRIRGLLNKTPPEKNGVVVNDLLRETLAVMENELRARQMVVATELVEPSPRIMGDRVQLQQVVLNLIMNGAEAHMWTAPGSQGADSLDGSGRLRSYVRP